MSENKNFGYLLDSHTMIWMIDNPERLSKNATNILLDTDSTLYYSMVSIWEIAIKTSIGKLVMKPNWQNVFKNELTYNQIKLLPISWQHTDMAEKLPFEHKDPFDRMLIAQAKHEKLALLSCDTVFKHYDVENVW